MGRRKKQICSGLVVLSALVVGLAGLPASCAKASTFDQELAWSYLLRQVEFGPRNPGSEGHEACLDWLLKELRDRADAVSPHSFVLVDPYGDGLLQLTNIRASFRPEASTRVAFAAHWDTRPRADRDPGDEPGPPIDGANDGASGVAVLLALADLLATDAPPIGVDLLFFDGEDYGREGELEYYILGSRRFVADFPHYRPSALVLLDMVGGKGLRVPMEAYSQRRNPRLVRTVFNRAAALGLTAFVAEPGPAVYDDHLPFLERAIPAIDLVDLDYPEWHSSGDSPSACSAESLGQTGRLLNALIRQDFARGEGLAP